jgi:predicted nucleic acid-binding protein
MIVLDTNVISEAMKPEPSPAVRAWSNEQIAETLYLTSVTLAEILFGIAVLPAGRRRERLDARTRRLTRVVPRSRAAVRHRRATTPRSLSLRATSGADSRRRMDTSRRSPPRVASSSRHVTRHPTRPAGSRSSTRGEADSATLADSDPYRRVTAAIASTVCRVQDSGRPGGGRRRRGGRSTATSW